MSEQESIKMTVLKELRQALKNARSLVEKAWPDYLDHEHHLSEMLADVALKIDGGVNLVNQEIGELVE